ncbi:Dabb family protein [Gemmatimonas sp.]|uniref:Dabb family protein n=1 Tax=Gemmatimonas sp. TaxID=1962908 RepID=UPI0022BE5853|nr:Dabb family protein [Gemmatimonas sp.]MCZ8206062.1 Dabb family protein [Gemmatimonas sp.]
MPMLVHAVYFWLRPDLSEDERASFERNLQALSAIPSQGCYIGTPASTDRPVIDRTYTWALVLLFRDMAEHDAYQVHPAHQQFVAENKSRWSRVQIYDSE